MSDNLPERRPTGSEIVFYQTEDGRSRIEVRLEDNTVWLTQRLMAELFQTTPQNITMHLRGIYADGELSEEATCKEYSQVQQETGRSVERRLRFYNLEVILSVGYRVRSERGTQFRRWATERLREYLVKGFLLEENWGQIPITERCQGATQLRREVSVARFQLRRLANDEHCTSQPYQCGRSRR